ncbi:hypothetical protein [Nocardia wallacei]|uniref:hypothetical protein n=1 Tax=Nocardia wallacei TaxID=480035 RepID=UPI002455832A|nr:hypothetical protein [Nocardia wallacei]
MTPFPSRTTAILIGLEDYTISPSWQLNGPVPDMVEFARWLLDRGVDVNRITMLASPLGGNRNELDEVKPGTWRMATKESIYHALTSDLHAQSSEMLIIYLGGHGFVHGGDRRLLYPDATARSKINLNITSLLESLRTNSYASHPRQLIFVDTCLTYAQDLRWVDGVPDETFAAGQRFVECDQRAYFAASPGQRASNDGLRRTGLFSAALRDALNAPAGEHLLDGKPADLLADLQTRLLPAREAGRTEQVPSYLAFSHNGSEEILANVGADESRGERQPEVTVEGARNVAVGDGNVVGVQNVVGNNNRINWRDPQTRILIILGSVLTIAAVTLSTVFLLPGPPRPILELVELAVAEPGALDADGINLVTRQFDEKTQIDATDADITLRNNGSAPAVITELKVEILFARQMEDCAQAGGGPAIVSGRYSVKIPKDPPPTPFTLTRPMRFEVRPGTVDRMAVTIGPEEQNMSLARPYVFAARISLVHDKSDQPLDVGTVAMVTTPDKADFQIAHASSFPCIERSMVLFEELYEIQATRSTPLDRLRDKYAELLAPDPVLAKEQCQEWKGSPLASKLCARYSRRQLEVKLFTNDRPKIGETLAVIRLGADSDANYTMTGFRCRGRDGELIWATDGIVEGITGKPPVCRTDIDQKLEFDEASGSFVFTVDLSAQFDHRTLELSAELKRKSGENSFVTVARTPQDSKLHLTRGKI